MIENNKRRLMEDRLEALTRLNNGKLTPDNVLKDAESKDSPLHDYFEWDDSKAATQYRLDQARDLIRSVKVEIVTNERVISTVRYIRDPECHVTEQGYVEVTAVKQGVICSEFKLSQYRKCWRENLPLGKHPYEKKFLQAYRS